MCVRTSVSCPLHSLVVRAPLEFMPGSYSMGNLPPFLPQTPRSHSHDVFVSTVDKTGGSLGPPISPTPWGDMAHEWQDPQTVHRIILVFPTDALLSSPHRLHLVFTKIYLCEKVLKKPSIQLNVSHAVR